MSNIPKQICGGAFLLTSLLFFFISTPCKADEIQWKIFRPKGGRFVINMPKEPELETKVVDTPVGDIDTYRYVAEVDKFLFAAGYADIPSLIVLFGSQKKIYDRVRDEFLKKAYGEQISYKKFSYDAYRCRELIYRSKDRYGKVRLMMISRRMYLLMASVPHDYPDTSIIDRYLASFRPIYRKALQPHGSNQR